MRPFVLALMLIAAVCHGADEETARLRDVAKKLVKEGQEALVPLKDLQGVAAAQFVLEMVGNKRLDGGIKARVAEIVAMWPATAPGSKTLHEWLAQHPRCDDDALLFFAEIHLPETRSYFWSLIEQAKGEPATVQEPQRVAMAVKGLGFFEDNPESVVVRIGSLLAVEWPHVIRACAAEALGGMKNTKAVAALVPHVEDEAIGPRVERSLYRLTGQHFDEQPGQQWREWLQANEAKIEFKMHAAVDFDNFLKVQALVKPDDGQMNMNTFYGLDVRGKGLLFILDVSGSMIFNDRIGKLRAQMSNILVILASRTPKTRFGIITFGNDIESCFPRGIMDNTEDNRHKAERFVEQLKSEGQTPMVEALTYAYNKVLPDKNIDTIFFLSDGQPSDGTPDMVLDITRKIYQRYEIRFNTFGVDDGQSLLPGRPPGMPGPAGPRGPGMPPGMPGGPGMLPGRPEADALLKEMAAITRGVFTHPK